MNDPRLVCLSDPKTGGYRYELHVSPEWIVRARWPRLVMLWWIARLAWRECRR